ncbi:MAG: four helix bundle protein [Thermoguttaceae bacterium]|nr:four helix bundle protein [Thermoguttaceae bacterium]
MKQNIIREKSRKFAVRIVRLYQYLREARHEFVLSKQLLRSGTSIGANIREGDYAQSRADFIAKMTIALKESAETEYWLELLAETGYLTEEQYASIHQDAEELLRILTRIINTAKKSQRKNNDD